MRKVKPLETIKITIDSGLSNWQVLALVVSSANMLLMTFFLGFRFGKRKDIEVHVHDERKDVQNERAK